MVVDYMKSLGATEFEKQVYLQIAFPQYPTNGDTQYGISFDQERNEWEVFGSVTKKPLYKEIVRDIVRLFSPFALPSPAPRTKPYWWLEEMGGVKDITDYNKSITIKLSDKLSIAYINRVDYNLWFLGCASTSRNVNPLFVASMKDLWE